LIRVIGKRDGADPLDGEHPQIFSQMVIGDQVEAARSVRETIRIDFPPAGCVARGGEIPDPRGSGFIDGLGDQVYRLFVLLIVLCGPGPMETRLSSVRTYSVSLRRFQIAAHRASVFRVILGDGFDKL
jgi:hypothetical protein